MWELFLCFNLKFFCLFQISEELEKVKQEMEEKGSSMSDGGEVNLVTVLGFDSGLPQCWPLRFFFCFCSSGGENQAEPDEAEAGDHSDGRADRRGGAHAASGQTQGEVQHDARHARHQHPRARRWAVRLAQQPRPEKPGEVRLL